MVLLLGGFCISCLNAQESTQVFFNFNVFEDRIKESYTNLGNIITNVNGEAYAEVGSDMFMLSNWLVTLSNKDGENPLDNRDSYSRRITSQEQGTVLGVRVKFPDWPFPGEAFVRPTFPILPFKRTGEYDNINNGVVTNVGIVKSVSMWVNGRNFNNLLSVRMLDADNKIKEFLLGSMRFLGWRKLVYNNSSFPTKPADALPALRPFYPVSIPFLRFDSFVIYRQSNSPTGDYIGYLGNSEIVYSSYYVEEDKDINDELEWGIKREEQEKQGRGINSALYDKIIQYEYARKRLEYTRTGGSQQNAGENQQIAGENQQ